MPSPPSTPGTRFPGWRIVASAHVLFALIFGAMYSFGALLPAIQQHFGGGRFSVAAVFSLTAFVYYLIGPLAGAWADCGSPRAIVALGILLLVAGLSWAALASSLPMLMVGYCLLAGVGVGLVYVPAIAVVQRWFVRQRARASGLALAGTGVGTFAGPLLANAAGQAWGWQGAMAALAAGVLVLGALAAWQLIGRPSDVGLAPDADPMAPGPAQPVAAPAGLSLRQAVRRPCFWWFYAAIACVSVGLFVALVHLAPQARQLGLTPASASLVLGLIGLGNIAGRLGLGALGDRWGVVKLVTLLIGAAAALQLIWLAARSFEALAVFALLFGAAHGGCIALFPAIAARWFGTASLGAVLGALYASVGVAALVGPSAAGAVFDATQGYAAAIGASALLSAVAVACMRHAARASA